MKHAIFLLFAIALTLQSTSGSASPAKAELDTYSVLMPIDPIYDDAEVAVRTVSFNNWLNANVETITPERLPQMREHLYYLIDSYIKNRFDGGSPALPSERDAVLAMLFSWAERLGVYGGTLVYEDIRPETMSSVPSFMKVSDQFELGLSDGLYRIGAANGAWQARVPYYFMIGQLQEFEAANGQQTQLAIISTGAARHIDVEGHSQATLMLVYSPDKDAREFEAFWLQQYGLDKSSPKKGLAGTDLKSRYRLDEATSIHTEFVHWPIDGGTIGVAYLGVNGTYQYNRPHFLDFLSTIETN